MEDNLWWKATFGGRQLLVEDNPCMLPSPLCGIFSVRLFCHKMLHLKEISQLIWHSQGFIKTKICLIYSDTIKV